MKKVRSFAIPTNVNEMYDVCKAIGAAVSLIILYLVWKNCTMTSYKSYEVGDVGYLIVNGMVYASVVFEEYLSAVTDLDKFTDLDYWHEGEFAKACELCENGFFKARVVSVINPEPEYTYKNSLMVHRMVPDFSSFHVPRVISPTMAQEADLYLNAI